MLLYGPAGTGKTSSISVAARKYAAEGKTALFYGILINLNHTKSKIL